jgi:glycosyltransferase involved in cell wall biosynthesis
LNPFPQRQSLRKVVIINTSDLGGGAERMSMAVLDGFTALGIDTWLLVGEKKTDHPRVMPFFLSPFFDYRPYDTVLGQTALEARRRFDLWLGIEDFNHPYAHRILELTGSPPDLVVCYNLHGGYFDLRAIAKLSHRVPVVLRLCDSWLLTGHCAMAPGCQRWQTGCGRCPDLKMPPAIRRDATRFNWWRKRRIFRSARLFVSAESQWMLDRARQSMLAPAAAGWKLIPGGVDLAIFSPGSKTEARRQLGLDAEGHFALYVANHGPENAYKDFNTVRQALVELARRDPARRLELLAVGSEAPEDRIAPGIVIRWLGYVRSQERMANLYRAADVFVHSSLEETYGLSLAEALACGTPAVVGSRGGILESVQNEQTALVVPSRNPIRLADGIARLLDTPELRTALGQAGAAIAEARFDIRTMIGALHEWCAEIHASWDLKQ